MTALHNRIRQALNAAVAQEASLAGGCVGDVRRIVLADGRQIVAKVAGGDSSGRAGQDTGLAVEGFMLRYLADHSALPVPRVLFADSSLLLMDYIPAGGSLTATAQEDAAVHLEALHSITAKHFGFDCDTVIGGLRQINTPAESWRDFFRDQRLMAMAHEAHRARRLGADMLHRLEHLSACLDRWIDDTATPGLIHGDMWGGNILVRDGKIAGFVDPAISYSDPEIELAFATLFGTFGDAFFRRYTEIRPLAPGFFEERRDLYNLYPLLVHVRLFGGNYVGQVDGILRRFGF